MKKYLTNFGIWLGIYLIFGFAYHSVINIYTEYIYIHDFLLVLVPSVGLLLLRFKNDKELLGQTVIVLTCILISSIATKKEYGYSFSYLLLLSGITYAALSKLLELPALHQYQINNRYKLYTLSVFITTVINIIFKSI
jgi:hypothetical protein